MENPSKEAKALIECPSCHFFFDKDEPFCPECHFFDTNKKKDETKSKSIGDQKKEAEKGPNIIQNEIKDNPEYKVPEPENKNVPVVKKASAEMEWISVNARLPKEGVRCLVFCSNGYLAIGYLYNKKWESSTDVKGLTDRGYKITHWMRLPEPPQ